MYSIEYLQEWMHKIAKSKGWWDSPRTPAELIALVHCELSEALECIREGDDPSLYEIIDGKPEGFGIELADAVIRIMDISEHCGLNLGDMIAIKAKYNETRPHRHGGKVL